MPANTSQSPSLTIRRHIKAAPARIFSAWTHGPQLMQWFGPDGSKIDSAEIDPKPGARYRILFHTPDGEQHGVGGTYREVVPDQKLVFTWAWRSTPERESLVTITLTPEGEGTLLTLLHEQFFDEIARDRHQQGWTGAVEKLAHFVEKKPTPQRFVAAEPLTIVGLEERYQFSRMAELPLQWQRFMPVMGTIPGRIDKTTYGFVRPRPDGFDYLAGVGVTGDAVPAGMTLHRLPAQRFAVFPHAGPVSTMRTTTAPILHNWLPTTGRMLPDLPFFLERYGPGFDPATLSGDIEIWFPVKD